MEKHDLNVHTVGYGIQSVEILINVIIRTAKLRTVYL